jgi:uncharacterized RDD family membrane protein YckC
LSNNVSPAAFAGLARRAGSMLYEALLLIAILFISTWVFLFFAQALERSLAMLFLRFWLMLVMGVYFVYCWSHGGQTLPMKTWHIRLVMRDGSKVTRAIAIKRYLLAVVSIGACGLGLAWGLLDRDHQFLHDRIVGTRLVMRTD